jgi:uncharacterized protein (DUF1810 family)
MSATPSSENASDPHALSRFLEAQAHNYSAALRELRAGAKQSHWMWYVFPQVAGLGFSSMAQRYAIRTQEEARAYLAHPVLGPRLVECAEALLEVKDRSAEQIMGNPDCLKLQSSLTLFSAISPPASVFDRVLEKYYDGAKDPKTLQYLARDGSARA